MNEPHPAPTPRAGAPDSAAPVNVLVLSVLLSRGRRQYRQTFLAPVNPDPMQFPHDDEVEWLKGYFRLTGYQLEGHYITNRDAWMIETTTTQEVATPVQFGPIGAPQRLDDEPSTGRPAGNDGNAAVGAEIEAEIDDEDDDAAYGEDEGNNE